ncbi:MAG: hypothetical protein KBS65_03585 [Prevotella sp.]|nr:hypothetical protein [Candidatus Equicola stercoris]
MIFGFLENHIFFEKVREVLNPQKFNLSQMKFNLSQSKIYSSNKFGRFSRLGIVQASLTSALGLTKRSSNFHEALQPQSVNKFTLDVCTPSRLLKQSHKFCTRRAAAHLLGATQRTLLYEDGNSEIQKIRNSGNKTIKKINLCAAIAD